MSEHVSVLPGQVWQKKYPPNRLRVVPRAFVVVKVGSLFVHVENTEGPKRHRTILRSAFVPPTPLYRLVGLKREEP